MDPVVTKDGSTTFFNTQYNEHYHCLAGALAEATVKHVTPASKYMTDGCTILDFCFGLGYNTIAALKYADDNNIKNIKIYALESDIEIIKKVKDITLPEEFIAIRDVLANLAVDSAVFYKTHEIVLLLGDAQETLNNVASNCTVVFFDPFSPKKQPELWTEDIFMSIYNKMKVHSLLTTYSCARHVREKMLRVGFCVVDGPVFGRKSASTLAVKD